MIKNNITRMKSNENINIGELGDYLVLFMYICCKILIDKHIKE